jgi:putative addiction module component (TIGR02574 family)
MGKNDFSELLKLGAPERLAIAEQLWASVSSEYENAPPSDAEIVFVNSRLDGYLKNPQDTVPWAQVKKELGL